MYTMDLHYSFRADDDEMVEFGAIEAVNAKRYSARRVKAMSAIQYCTAFPLTANLIVALGQLLTEDDEPMRPEHLEDMHFDFSKWSGAGPAFDLSARYSPAGTSLRLTGTEITTFAAEALAAGYVPLAERYCSCHCHCAEGDCVCEDSSVACTCTPDCDEDDEPSEAIA